MLDVTILCSSTSHPIYQHLMEWKEEHKKKWNITLAHNASEAIGGKFLFLVSCTEIVKEEIRNRYRYTLVLHASDLPSGRGWSPHIWQVIEGKKTITVSLLEAENQVDTGKIWKKLQFRVEDHMLYDEINARLFEVELSLIDYAINDYENIIPDEQKGIPSYYRQRTKEDSCLDPSKSIEEQFNLIRVCDSERYPAFFYLNGCKYNIKINKANKDENYE